MTLASEKKILVVDDEPDVRDFISACLEDAGFQIRSAVDGVDALEKIEEEIPDLMTLDMVMPRKSGLSLMRKLRKNDLWQNIPVIIITAHAKDELAQDDVKELLVSSESKQSNRHLLEKPIVPSKLIDLVCGILNVSTDEDLGKREDLISAIKHADGDTLHEIRKVLGQ
ncbi:MAG: response regulator [Proteobacteria bacterium]|nr:response regulator [Pseudomonadota bacterium]